VSSVLCSLTGTTSAVVATAGDEIARRAATMQPRVTSLAESAIDTVGNVIEALRRGAAVGGRAAARRCEGGVLYGTEGGTEDVDLSHALDATLAGAAVTADAGSRGLYLAQCPLEVHFPGARDALDALWSDVAGRLGVAPSTPTFNVWANVDGAVSATHFDDDDGVLMVLRGRKEVTLAPPRLHDPLLAHPVWSTAYHHAAGGSVPPPESSRWCATPLVLSAGDAVLIPAGYWHHVVSAPGTLAVNAWFRGSVDMHPAVAVRKYLRVMVDQHVAAAVAARASVARRRLLEAGWEGLECGDDDDDDVALNMARMWEGRVAALGREHAAAVWGELNDVLCCAPAIAALHVLATALRDCDTAVAVAGDRHPCRQAAVWAMVQGDALVALAIASATVSPQRASQASQAWSRVWSTFPSGEEGVEVCAAAVDAALEHAREAAYRHVVAGAT